MLRFRHHLLVVAPLVLALASCGSASNLDGTAKSLPVTRVGAVCTDGSQSSAIGNGACSGHGGVQSWLYAQPAASSAAVAVAPSHVQPVGAEGPDFTNPNTPRHICRHLVKLEEGADGLGRTLGHFAQSAAECDSNGGYAGTTTTDPSGGIPVGYACNDKTFPESEVRAKRDFGPAECTMHYLTLSPADQVFWDVLHEWMGDMSALWAENPLWAIDSGRFVCDELSRHKTLWRAMKRADDTIFQDWLGDGKPVGYDKNSPFYFVAAAVAEGSLCPALAYMVES